MTPDPLDPDQQLGRLHEAVESVRREIRRLPPAAAVERLEVALRQHDIFLPREAVEALARATTGSRWALRHPLQATRERQRQSPKSPDTDSQRLEREANELTTKLDGILATDAFDYLSISSRRTVDGITHIVTIRPWSNAGAAQIRALADPIIVTVDTPDHGEPDNPRD